MNSQQKLQNITLEDIALRKEALLKEINIQKEVIGKMTRDIISPLVPAATAANKIQRTFSTGMAIFNGAMLGIKMIRRFRSFFR